MGSNRQTLGSVIEVGPATTTMLKQLLQCRGLESLSAEFFTPYEPALAGMDKRYWTRLHYDLFPGGQLHVDEERRIEILHIVAKGGEYLAFEDEAKYDTAIVWNVLEHAFNAFAILDGVYRSLKPNGTFIFSERLVRLEAADQIFHPMRFTESFLKGFLDAQFDADFYERAKPRRKFEAAFTRARIFFIGRKRVLQKK